MATGTPENQPPPAPGSKPRNRIAESVEQLWAERQRVWDVVIVGSGYGGATAAASFAGLRDSAGKLLSVCVLERGGEYLPSDFPSRFAELPGHARMPTEQGLRGNATGLFDVHVGKDVCALVGSGLGGGSLINAGVLVKADADEVKAQSAFGGALIGGLDQGGWYTKAINVLGGAVNEVGRLKPNNIARHPDHSSIKKGIALQALRPDIPAIAVPISVAMADEPNSAGVKLKACTLCGDCMTGCTVGAKNSLDTNLLHMAHQRGARVFTGVSVLSLDPVEDPSAGTWHLRAVCTDPALQAQQRGPILLSARHVVLAAGSLGSSEILLRSRSDKMPLSSELGAHFSCNGDNLAAFYGMAQPVNACADEILPVNQRTVGPTITRELGVNPPGPAPKSTRFRVQEFAIPAPLKRLFEEIVTTSYALQQADKADVFPHGKETPGAPDPLAVNPQAIRNTLVVGVIGHDDAKGLLRLEPRLGATVENPLPGSVRIHWPDARRGAALEASDKLLREWAERKKSNGTLLPNPLWKLLPGDLAELVSQPLGPVMTVHPLGGCAAGNTALDGVVDEYGQVLNPNTGEPHPGLAVLDGSVFGHSLGANPALTITAFAMRAAHRLARNWWYTNAQVLGTAPTTVPLPPVPTVAEEANPPPDLPLPDTWVEIVERMYGRATVRLNGKETACIVEMTLAFAPVGLRTMTTAWGRELTLANHMPATVGPGGIAVPVQRLRVFTEPDWKKYQLAHADDATRQQRKAVEYRFAAGHMKLLKRGISGPWQRGCRAGLAWACNRGIHEIGDSALRWVVKQWPFLNRFLGDSTPQALNLEVSKKPPLGIWGRFWGLVRLSTRAGEHRLLEYNLTASHVNAGGEHSGDAGPVVGVKTLTYNRRANPWQQLMRLELRKMPGLVVKWWRYPVLELDTNFLAGQGFPLMRITLQTNQADALMDTLSFGLYMARLLVHIHLWTFRRSDQRGAPVVNRLPGAIRSGKAGTWVEPDITELTVDHVRKAVGERFPKGQPVKIRLARYPKKDSKKPALVFIHGYSVSGNTFTHPSIPVSAAEYFWKDRGEVPGREVWVIELRTSTGMPSSTYPWSMEQVALIDIPAALLHVRLQTGGPVDVVAHCIGAAMLSMAMLTRASDVRMDFTAMGVDDWVNDAQLGTLEAFHGPESATVHPTVKRIVLSQKGPMLRYSDANIARAFIMQTQRRWLFNDVFSFQVPDGQGVAAELLDRLLASLPYPPADYDTQNPICPTRRTPWTQSRRRMDMLYGRDFSAENLHPDTLNAIDDLFGPMHLDTVAQTIHFARYNVITNQRGEGEFFTLGRLKKRWTVANTFAFHGADNGLVDASTNELLKDRFAAAGLPFQGDVIPKKGHQDVFIGRDNREVCGKISAFLTADPATPNAVAVAPFQWISPPWVGPRLDMPRHPQGSIRICATSRPDQGPAAMVLLPVYINAAGSISPGPLAAFIDAPETLAAGLWHRHEVSSTRLQNWVGQHTVVNGEHAWLALMVHDPDDVNQVVEAAADPLPNQTNAPAKAAPGAISLPSPSFPQNHGIGEISQFNAMTTAGFVGNPLFDRLQQWAATARPDEIQQSLVRASDVARAYDLLKPQDTVCFALGSCQYPPGLLDAIPAQKSLFALKKHLSDADAVSRAADLPRAAFAVFCGDQIYADASAGLADATRRDERYQVPHERALRQPAMRAVLQRLPSAMLIDDHEIEDNWSQLPRGNRQRAANERLRDHAMAAFLRNQRMEYVKNSAAAKRAADQTLDWGGLPIYLLDTRSQRTHRQLGSQAKAITAEQLSNLKAWLLAHRDQAKCIVTPSLFLPRRQPHLSGLRSDAFDGYPQTQLALIDFLVENDIRYTLFLSGDEHHAFACEATVTDPRTGRCIPLISIHSSALYAPYPFANGRLEDLQVPDAFSTAGPAPKTVSVNAIHPAPGDGLARIAVDRNNFNVRISFHRETGPPGTLDLRF